MHESAGDVGSSSSEEEELPEPPSPLIVLSPGRRVVDVDEEIFLLWTLHARSQHSGGLGYVDHTHDSIFIAIEGANWSFSVNDREVSGEIVQQIHQDVTSLRSERGNTGSVVWRSTVHLTIRILQGSVFDLKCLKQANVLELGAGTGALPALLANTTSSTWLATDQAPLIPLIEKNIKSAAASNCHAEPLDWFDFLNSPSLHSTQLRTKAILDHFNGESPDLIICCDCVYNPALFDALVATLNAFTKPNHTMVLMSCEMRSDESLTDFLSIWRSSHPSWQIVSLQERFEKGFVAFAAWRS